MSTNSQKYVLDTNVFITAHHVYYGFDIAPGFWRNLIDHAEQGRILSIDWVLAEIKKGHDPNDPQKPDELERWAQTEFLPYFAKTDSKPILDEYKKLINWVIKEKSYTEAAKNEFASIADSWLIAYAMSQNAVIVTLEKNPNKTSKISIPAVCEQFGIEYIDTFTMMKNLEIRLN